MTISMKTLITILLTILSLTVCSQKIYKIHADSSKITIKGTSTFHDWEVTSKDVNGSIYARIEDKHVKELIDVYVNIEVISLKSKTKGLAKRMYKELNYKQHPNITFAINKVINLTDTFVEIEGDLTINGVTKAINIGGSISIKNNDKDIILVLGTKKINMTDFRIDPPRFLLGIFSTGDEIDVEFILQVHS